MATRKPRRRDGRPTRKRSEVGTDPLWVNWEYLAAFGQDERGYQYLDAIKLHCGIKSAEDEWMDNLVRRARQAHDEAGHCQRGQEAAWRVFRRAGMILFHDLMLEVGVGKPFKPRAVFYSPVMARTMVVGPHWKLSPMAR